jgi:cytochrome c oxidase assembly factor CtaG
VSPFTPSSLVTRWIADPVGLALAILLTAGYAAGIVAARRRGARWSPLRAVWFFGLGVGSLVLAAAGGLAVYRGVLLPAAAGQAAVLSAMTPVGLALGDPVGLAELAWGERGRHVTGWLRAGPARVLMFPLFSSVLAVGCLLLLFVTPWLSASLSSPWVRELTYLALLGTGTMVVLPLLGEQLLPRWCTHPVRTLIAFADGLLDAVPGLFVMAWPRLLSPGIISYAHRPDPLWEQRIGGGIILFVGEVVGLPLLAAVIVGWVRSDGAEARAVDARLDAEPNSGRPWWETDPRFTDQYR